METSELAEAYRYTFRPGVPMGQVSNALFLAALAAEAIHGRAQVQLNGWFSTDPVGRTATIDSQTAVGRAIASVFTEFVSRELGEAAFTVVRVPRKEHLGPGPSDDEEVE